MLLHKHCQNLTAVHVHAKPLLHLHIHKQPKATAAELHCQGETGTQCTQCNNLALPGNNIQIYQTQLHNKTLKVH
jgi:hypothetical protein